MAEVFGNSGNNVVEGTIEADILRGLSGNDKLYDFDGDDQIFGGRGNDTFYSGRGFDTFVGGSGIDTLIIDADALMIEPQAITVFTNFITGESGAVETTFNRDVVNGIENYKLFGVLDVVLTGDEADNTFETDLGSDLIKGGSGSDTIKAGAGRDTIFGGKGYDNIKGERGADFIDGNRGNDKLFGGGGADTFRFSKGKDVIKDYQKGFDGLQLDDSLWSGNLTRREIINTFGSETADGVVLDFGKHELLLEDINRLNKLYLDIEIV